MKIKFDTYKDSLFTIILGDNLNDDCLVLIHKLSEKGYTKREIYDLFLVLFKEIQLDKRTKDSEQVYDELADFMDGFTAWGKGFKILPNEPDL
ncbi:MAG: hypothetical protein AAFY70_17530 [Bacteroidota bacterium]